MKKEDILQEEAEISAEELEQENRYAVSIMTQELKEEYRRNGRIRVIPILTEVF